MSAPEPPLVARYQRLLVATAAVLEHLRRDGWIYAEHELVDQLRRTLPAAEMSELDELRAAWTRIRQLEAELARRGRCAAAAPGAWQRQSFGVCTLPGGHVGWHHDEQSGMEWGPAAEHDGSTGG